MLAEINTYRKVMQTSEYTISQCCDALHILIESAQCDRGILHIFCTTVSWVRATSLQALIFLRFQFLSPRWQKFEKERPTNFPSRKNCDCLAEKEEYDVYFIEWEQSVLFFLLNTRDTGEKQKLTSEHEYMNLNFIIGSATEIERVWSICKYVQPEHL